MGQGKREAELNLEIRVGRLGGSRLMRDYYSGGAELSRFFPGSPWDPAAYRRKLEDVDRRFDRESRQRVTEALRPTAAAEDAVDAVANGDAVLVTTGQQAGLFGGPLYTIYKILSAIKLADSLEPVLERRVLPVFWVASDDHDWAEVNHTDVLDASNTLHRIRLDGDEAAHIPVGERRLGGGIQAAVEELRRVLPQGELSQKVVEGIEAIYRSDNTMGAAFAELIERWFAPFGLLVVDPRHPTMKALAAPVLQRELERSADHEARLAEQTGRLEAAGYHAQVTVLPGEANVFLEGDSGRERLVREADGWRTKVSGTRYAHGELIQLLRQEPRRFSPNVFLRPVVESTALPTVAYVGGPAEVSYFAQVGCLFAAHDVGMPLVFPRFGVQLIEAKVRKVLDKMDLEPEEFRAQPHEIAARVVREEFPESVRDALAALRRSWGEGFVALDAATRELDPTLKSPVQHARSTGFQQLDDAEKKIAAAIKRQGSVVVEQIEKARVNLFPHSQPQERVLNPTQYLARYGDDLLPAIAAAMTVEIGADAPEWAGVHCG